MFETQLFIPTFHNDGSAVEAATFAEWEAALADLFGGFSLYPGTVAGAWRSPSGETFTDRLRVYAVFLPSLTAGAAVGEAAALARSLFRQEAITIRYLGLSEIL